MKLSKLTLAVATALGSAGASTSALAIDLYVDVKTKQIYSEPGPHRQLMGSFVQVDETQPAKAAESAEMAAVKKDLETKTNEIRSLQEHMEEVEQVEVKLGDKGLEIATKDKSFEMALGGRMQLDGLVSQGSWGPAGSQLNNGAGMRRGRIHNEGKMFNYWKYKIEYDFVRGGGNNAAGLTDASVEFDGLKPFTMTAGQFKEPFSLQSVTSNRFITFLERSLGNNAFIEYDNPYQLGFSVQQWGKRWVARAALQSEPIGGGQSSTSLNSQGNANRSTAFSNGGTTLNPSGNPSWGPTARVNVLPFFEGKDKMLQVGVSGSYRTVNNTNPCNFAAGSTTGCKPMRFGAQITSVDRSAWADTGYLTFQNFHGVSRTLNDYYRVGAETAAVYGPLSVQSEFIGTQLQGQGYSNKDFMYGYYGFISYFLTGESRNWNQKAGKFDRLKINRDFSMKNTGWGAWELALGWDAINMNTANVSGGRLGLGKVALNWYPNNHVRIMANLEHLFDNVVSQKNLAYNTSSAFLQAINGKHPNIFNVRVQVDW